MLFIVAVTAVTLWSNQALTGQSEQQPRIELTGSADVSAARDIHDALHELGEKVTSCVSSSRTPEACRCAYPEALTALRQAYEKAMKLHPEWSERSLSFRYVDKDAQPISGLLVMPALRRQLEQLTCS